LRHQGFAESAKVLRANAGSALLVCTLFSVLITFIVVPIILVFHESFSWEGRFTLEHYTAFFDNPFFFRCFMNSLTVATASTAVSSLLGVPIAYILARYDIPGKKTLRVLCTMPLIMPPFVGALALKYFLGRHGTFNIILMEYLGFTEPVNFLYGLHGVVLVTSLNLYPLIMLNVMASLSKLDPSLEESAKNLGSKGFHLFRTITFPLVMPGFAAGAILVFIWSLSDFGTPLMIGSAAFDLLAPQAFFNITEVIEERAVRLGIVIVALLVLLSTSALACMRKYVSLRQYAVLTVGTAPGVLVEHVSGLKRYACLAFCVAVVAVSLLPHAGIIIGSFGTVWSFTVLPEGYTLDNFKTVLIDTPKYLLNSLRYSTLTTLFSLALGSAIAYSVVRRQFVGRNFLDVLAMAPFAIPGIAVAVGYIRLFRNPIPFTDFDLLSTWLIIPIALSIRNLPYALRASFAIMQQIHVSLEEASMNLGATRLYTFFRITLPLLLVGLLTGGVIVFVSSMEELSTSWLLSLPGRGWEPMSVGIMVYSQLGIFGQAAAIGAVLIFIVTACVAIAYKLAGARTGIAFGG